MLKTDQTALSDSDVAEIRQYEAAAQAAPKAYARKVVFAAVTGYLTPLVFLSLLLLGVFIGVTQIANEGAAAATAIKLVIGIGALALMVGRSLLVHFATPEARRVKREDASALFDEIDQVRKRLNGPKIHEIYIDDHLNASIEQAPRYGLFGGHINRLIIGLPMMQLLTVNQFRAVIGHEYGHLAGAHGKTDAWIYRTRMLWHRLYNEIEESGGLLYFPLRAFIKVFAPWFDKLSFPLARANEYEADKAGASVSDPQTAADALMRVTLAARFLDDTFWQAAWRRADHSPTPDVFPQRSMAKAFQSIHAWPQRADWARDALRVKTDFIDTHPSLADRIKSLGAKPRLIKTGEALAVTLIDDAGASLRSAFDLHWRNHAANEWNELYREAEKNRALFKKLETTVQKNGSLAPDAALRRAALAERLLGSKEAIARYKQMVAWHPKDPRAWYALGRLLTAGKDARGLACLKRASEINPALRHDAAALTHQYHVDMGNQPKADRAADILRTERARFDAAINDVYEFNKKTQFDAHGLDDDVLAPITEVVGALPGIREAHILRLSSDLFEDFHGYHLILTPKIETRFNYFAAAEMVREIEFDGHLYFWFAVQEYRWLRKRGAAIPGAALNLAPHTILKAAA